MRPKYFDTHAHLDDPAFEWDLEAVLDRARAAGVERTVAIGTDLESSRRVLALSEDYEGVHAVVGWHPCEAMKAPATLKNDLRTLAAHPKVVALGETGLDYHHAPSDQDDCGETDVEGYRARQAEVFCWQLELAVELGLHCVIHQRDAFDDTLAQFEPFAEKGVRGVFHCFVNDRKALGRILGLGSLVSYTGIISFKNAALVRETLREVPLDGFMLETDCPYLAPVPNRGKRCEPAYVADVAKVACEVRGCSPEALSAATCENARLFFRGLG